MPVHEPVLAIERERPIQRPPLPSIEPDSQDGQRERFDVRPP